MSFESESERVHLKKHYFRSHSFRSMRYWRTGGTIVADEGPNAADAFQEAAGIPVEPYDSIHSQAGRRTTARRNAGHQHKAHLKLHPTHSVPVERPGSPSSIRSDKRIMQISEIPLKYHFLLLFHEIAMDFADGCVVAEKVVESKFH